MPRRVSEKGDERRESVSSAASARRRVEASPLPFLLFTLVFVLIAVGAFWLLGEGRSQLEAMLSGKPASEAKLEKQVQLFASEAESQFIWYNDSDYGFALKYPLGYQVANAELEGARVRIMAHYPYTSSEVIDTMVSQEKRAGDLLNESIAQVTDPQAFGANVSKQGETKSIQGKIAYYAFGSFVNELTDETIFFRQYAFDCQKPDGSPYSALLVAAIPDKFTPDLEMVDYMAGEFKC
jgi:hypothetical protein